ncbi:MAG TPA: hypothetical protein DDW76_00140 [Cyanobacteria bacterium UBA11369]|nr:hypothetical protein [Cyanobacteria bacterium UBA11371]HBE36334.1 hypothetical protein [Cyanobacteria bacterium UBA11368]HBE47252.1 hypothetical protein [Cyanobacteria bacterium UBA11369]
MSTFESGSIFGTQNYSGIVDSATPFDLYNASLGGLSNNADVLLGSSGNILSSSSNSTTTPDAIAADNFITNNYSAQAFPVNNTTDLDLNRVVRAEGNISANNNQIDPLTGQNWASGYFTVGEAEQVSFDIAFDGGWYKNELAVFRSEGMDKFVFDSPEFIKEAAKRSLSNSELGYVIFSDATEDAKFSGGLLDGNYNDSQYKGIKTFTMKPGANYGFMLVPNGTVQEVFNNPNLGGDKRPIFSLIPANSQASPGMPIADINGAGNAIGFEDLPVVPWADKDYNDLIVKMTGAKLTAPPLNELINPVRDWRNSDQGKQFLDYLKTGISAPLNQPLIAFIDTGFGGNNPDLDRSRMILGRDRISNDDNPLLSPGEGNEHGTHILGLVAATKGNNIGIDGINDKAPVWLGRAVGSGAWADSLIEFVDVARIGTRNAIVNLSLDLTQINPNGSTTTRYEFTPKERQALEYARQNQVLIVTAAGNDGDVMSVLGQASQEFDNIITVGAANGNQRADYSSFGYGLDIVTEGGAIANPIVSTVGNSVGTMAGTSVAAAQVTGAASLVWSTNSGLNYQQVINALKSNATDLNTPGWDKETGAGLLNVDKAVEAAKTIVPVAYTPDAFLTPTTWGGEGKVTPMERAAYDLVPGEFTSIIWSDNGVNLRNSPNLSDRSNLDVGYKGETFTFNAWTYGEAVPDLTTGEPDALWYRINVDGKDYWVPSAYTNGYPPGNPPLLPPVDNPPPVDNSGINQVSVFNGTVIATAGANVRDESNTTSAIVGFKNYNASVPFDAWKTGENVNIPGLGQSDRWYRIADTDDWISAVLIDGQPGNSDPGGGSPPISIEDKISQIAQQYNLGNPTSEVIYYSDSVTYQLFENGSVVSSEHGTFPLYGGIRQEYLSTGGLNGGLGAPTSAEIDLGGGNVIQYFEGGHIYWNGSKATAYYSGTTPPKTSPNIGSQLGVTMPDFNQPAYRENNIFWQSGYAPASTHPAYTNLGNALGNCTWYVNGRLQELGYNTTVLNKLSGNAYQWDDQAAAAGISMSNTPQVGDIAQWESGHVAVVEKVNPDGTILISESSYTPNSGSAADYLYKTETISALSPSRFIHVPRSSSSGTGDTIDYNSLTPVKDIGTLSYGERTISDYLESPNGYSDDKFKFHVDVPIPVNIKLHNLNADLDLSLIKDRNNNGRIDDGEAIDSSDNGGSFEEVVEGMLQPGDYYAVVYPGSSGAKTDYQLTFSIDFKHLMGTTGVDVYQRESDYVQVVDMSKGASVEFLHGQITKQGDSPEFEFQTIEEAWNDFSEKKTWAFSVSNGQYFIDQWFISPLPGESTQVSHPLKVDAKILSKGGDDTKSRLMLEVWSAEKANIETYDWTKFSSSPAPNILVGLNPGIQVDPDQQIGRTFIGIADPYNDGINETVLIFTGKSTQSNAINTLNNFGAKKVIMLDGSGSSKLNVMGQTLLAGDVRQIPQTIGVVSGQLGQVFPGDPGYNSVPSNYA